jgi:hypothetical protein
MINITLNKALSLVKTIIYSNFDKVNPDVPLLPFSSLAFIQNEPEFFKEDDVQVEVEL